MFLMDLENKERNNFKTSNEVLYALIPMVVYYQAVVRVRNEIKEHFKDD